MIRPLAALAGALAVLLTGCAGVSGEVTQPPDPGSSQSAPATESTTLTVLTHDSFSLPEETLAAFEKASGYKVSYVQPGDGGTLVNQLILTKDAPLGDVVFGIDNTFAGRAIDAGVLASYTSPALPDGAADLATDGKGFLTPIDYGDVCLNADLGWFQAKGLAVPQTLDDLVKPEYADLLVVPNPASSTPGLAFLIATVAAKGDGYLDYWKQLKANGLKVVPGWTEAYTVEFSGSAGKGPRPLVLSYASSPASELGEDGQPRTANLPQTCLRQVEYAGVLAGAQNEVGARKFVDWLLSPEVQAQIPSNMWMYPADPATALPEDWAKFGTAVDQPWYVPAETIAAQRDSWIRDWTTTVIG
ncbi:MAG: thiamine ABC transporter substrate-binding protein [Propionicimonas sp.]|nr:thiamine ABC transporter substrate-binding protein [Propionicimonas sp.]